MDRAWRIFRTGLFENKHPTAISSALEASRNGQTCYTYYPPTNLYQWGPNDKIIRVGRAASSSPTEATPPVLSSAIYTTAHWDGDSLLFTSLPNGNVRNVNFDGIAESYPAGIGYSQFAPWTIPGTYTFWVYDYNQAGGIDDARTSTAPHATYNATTPAAVMDGYIEGPVSAQQLPLGLDPVSRDALSDSTINVSGVRTFEPGTTQWSTPDAADPASASAYVWDNSNPYMFRDPTGYAATCGSGDTTGANNPNGMQQIGCVQANPAPVQQLAEIDESEVPRTPLGTMKTWWEKENEAVMEQIGKQNAETTERRSEAGLRSAINRSVFASERRTWWKAEAKGNPKNWSTENLERMKEGKPPIGTDGFPMELHHVDRTMTGGLEPMTRTDHRLGANYKMDHPVPEDSGG